MKTRQLSANNRSTLTVAAALALAAGGLLLGGQANAQNYNNYNGQQRLRCDSNDGRQRVCRPQFPASNIQLARQFSKARCTNGYSYGLTRDGQIWVSNGCRADFIVTANSRYRNSPNGNAWGWRRNNQNQNGQYGQDYGYGGQQFRCESNNGRENICNVDARYGVQLVRQLSSSPCIEGRTWGSNRNGVWVNNGCRGEFVTGRR